MMDESSQALRLSHYASVLEELASGAAEGESADAEAEERARSRALVERMLAGLADARALPALDVRQRGRAQSLFAAIRREERAWGLRRLLARLVPAPLDPAPARRTGTRRAPFHALYELEGHDLDLYLGEDGSLLGQILAREGGASVFEGGLALLQAQGDDLIRAPIELDGEFRFAAPPSGSLRLVLCGGGLEAVVEELELPST